MIEGYVSLILIGKRGFYEVPLSIKEEVKNRLIELGRNDLVDD